MSNLVVNTLQSKILAALRPPSAKRAYVAKGFGREGTVNLGLVLRFDASEPVLAPGSGTVESVRWQRKLGWQALTSDLNAYEVVINHGQGVLTVVTGLGTISVRAGMSVSRGDALGTLNTSECWFGCRVDGTLVNPASISRHFVAAQERDVPGQSHRLRHAPDTILRNLANRVVRLVYNGIQYFQNVLFHRTFLVSVDFNGSGTKNGMGATGLAATDFWNVYAAGAFTMDRYTGYSYSSGHYYYYCAGIQFSRNPQVFLFDYAGQKTAVNLERVASASSASNTATAFDPMLASYIGGYSGDVPEENFFSIKGLPAGTYHLYLYAGQGALSQTTTFYVAVDNGEPAAKSATPSSDSSFVEDHNYVRYTVTVASRSYVSVKAYGYLAGLQLISADVPGAMVDEEGSVLMDETGAVLTF